MNRTVIDLWVGIFVAIGIAALLFLALKVGNLSSSRLSETYALQARFDNIGPSRATNCTRSCRTPSAWW